VKVDCGCPITSIWEQKDSILKRECCILTQ